MVTITSRVNSFTGVPYRCEADLQLTVLHSIPQIDTAFCPAMRQLSYFLVLNILLANI